MKYKHSEAFLKKQEMKKMGLIPIKHRTGFDAPFRKEENPREYMRLYMAWRRKNFPEKYEREKMQQMAKARARGVKPMHYVKDMSSEELAQRAEYKKEYRRVYERLHRKELQAYANERYRTDPEFKSRVNAATRAWAKRERKTNPLFKKLQYLSQRIWQERHHKNRSVVLAKLLLEREEVKRLNKQMKLRAKKK